MSTLLEEIMARVTSKEEAVAIASLMKDVAFAALVKLLLKKGAFNEGEFNDEFKNALDDFKNARDDPKMKQFKEMLDKKEMEKVMGYVG